MEVWGNPLELQGNGDEAGSLAADTVGMLSGLVPSEVSIEVLDSVHVKMTGSHIAAMFPPDKWTEESVHRKDA